MEGRGFDGEKRQLSSKIKSLKFMQRSQNKEEREREQKEAARVLNEAHWELEYPELDLGKPKLQVEYTHSYLPFLANPKNFRRTFAPKSRRPLQPPRPEQPSYPAIPRPTLTYLVPPSDQEARTGLDLASTPRVPSPQPGELDIFLKTVRDMTEHAVDTDDTEFDYETYVDDDETPMYNVETPPPFPSPQQTPPNQKGTRTRKERQKTKENKRRVQKQTKLLRQLAQDDKNKSLFSAQSSTSSHAPITPENPQSSIRSISDTMFRNQSKSSVRHQPYRNDRKDGFLKPPE